jgi:Domain of unknown function (DUF4082)/Bacterial Ig-like domain/Bacterial Ig domain
MSLATRHRIRSLVALLGLAAATLSVPLLAPPANAAIDPCGPEGNKISCENSKPGSPRDVWDIDGAGDNSIQGFATDISVNVGQRIDFKIDTDATAYKVEIYRTGYYAGDGARKIDTVTPSASLPQTQPACISDVATDLYDCGNWGVSASWNVPSSAVSGVYIARLERTDNGGTSHITFVVRDDASTSDVVFQTADPTWHAYNGYGGANFYEGGSAGRAFKLSYNRPFATRGRQSGRDFYMSSEYAMVRFMERNGYDVSYIAGVDTDRRGALLTNHRVFLSVGHDEYWSGAQRANVEAARGAGVNLMFLSGNEVYWRTRYEPSIDGTNTSYRTLVSYKETWANRKLDPSAEWTGTWRDPRYAPQSAGANRPENALTGTMYMANFSDLAMQVKAEEGKLRLWRNTSVASLATGATATLAPHTVGYESNEDLDNGSRPAGMIRLSTTTGAVPEYLQDFGNTVAPGVTTHHLTLYRAPSGALVFSAGSVQWAWGLDGVHDSAWTPEPADVRMQQAQVNLFADMGVQPTTLAVGLVAAAKSTDAAGPTTVITAPAAGASKPNGTSVTVTGTATDTGGGRVAGVEVSTDGGATWHPASGTSSWTYTYVQKGVGTVPLRARATDDSVNTGPVASINLAVACPCSIFGPDVPTLPAADDNSSAELGLRFQPASDGFVEGVRFYKGTGNGGTHVGSLWSSTGERLATVTFANETATGWQSAAFSQPVAVTGGEKYVVSYTAPQGRYAARSYAFSAAGVDAAPLSVEGGFGTTAGFFANAGQFPNNSYRNTNYYVDVLFNTLDNSPLSVNNRQPLPGSSSVNPADVISARYTKPVTAGSVQMTVKSGGQNVAGTTAYAAATRTVTFTPASALANDSVIDVEVKGTDDQGNPVTAGGTWSFRTARASTTPGVCPCRLFDDVKAPSVLLANDPDAVSLGVRFAPLADGRITALRFYKGGPENSGAHVGTLWSDAGTALASGTFTNESTKGWQTLTLDSPVTVTKNTDYVASYRATAGRYSLNPDEFSTSDLSRGPLKVASNSGSYTYGAGFPNQRSTANYLVDVVFERDAVAVSARGPAAGATDVDRSSAVNLWMTGPIGAGASIQVAKAGVTIPGTTTLGGDGRRLTFVPSGLLPVDSLLQVSVTGLVTEGGAPVPDEAWTFRTDTTSDADQPQTLLGQSIPTVESVGDADPVELGLVFSPAVDGVVRAVRFFKGPANTGAHTGTLWTSDGQSLGSVAFGGETASGWQKAAFATPIAVTAGTTYVVSYYAPQGGYAATSGYFASPRTVGDLTAPAGANGRFRYAAGGGFPQGSFGSANYWVDVVFKSGTAPLAMSSRTPAPDATGVVRTDPVTVTFSRAVAAGAQLGLSSGAGPIATTTTLSSDGRTLTATPTAALPADTVVAVALTGAVAADNGAALGPQSWQFRTAAPSAMTIASRVPAASATSVARTAPVSVTFSQPVRTTGYTMQLSTGAGQVSGSVARSADGLTLTFTPTATLAASTVHTVTLTGVTSTDGAALATTSWTFTTAARPTLTQSMFTGITPAGVSNTGTVTEAGTHFTPSVAGEVTAIRFYKFAQDTGTHTVSLWRANGTRLARVTVTGETATGWQQMALPTPVALTAGTAYVVSYTSPNGRVAMTNNFFTTTPYDAGPLRALRSQNGRFRYASGLFPNSISTNGGNYFVDPVFRYLGP